jgi:hypothetical protein
MESLECITALDEWRPSNEGVVDDIRLEISKTKLEVSKISRNWECAILDQSATSLGVFATMPVVAPAAVERPPLGTPATTPNGHCVDNHYRESGFGVVSTLIHSSVKDMPPPPQPLLLCQFYNPR